MKVQLPLGVGKYQICSVKGCKKDAITEFYAMDAKGNLRCMGACDTHILEVRLLAAQEAMRSYLETPELGQVNKHAVFGSSAKEATKSKEAKAPVVPKPGPVPPDINAEDDDDDAAPPPAAKAPKAAPKPVKELKAPKPIKARASWRWAEEDGTWMTADGNNVVAISELSDDELMGAALAIFKGNFERFRGANAWIGTLDVVVPYEYNTHITQGEKKDRRVAAVKLAEFHTECAKRNLCEPI